MQHERQVRRPRPSGQVQEREGSQRLVSVTPWVVLVTPKELTVHALGVCLVTSENVPFSDTSPDPAPMTTNALATVAPNALSPLLSADVDRARSFASDARSSSTRKAYAADFAAFRLWADTRGLEALPATPATVGVYLGALADAGRKVATIDRALAGIMNAHTQAGHRLDGRHPAIRDVRAGIRRTLGVAPSKKAPLEDVELRSLLASLDESLSGLRDRALLVLGWTGAFRRSELVALSVADVAFGRDGLVITVRRSKTDQEGRGFEKGLPYAGDPATCPVRVLRAWLEAAGIEAGPLFRAVDQHGHVSPDALSDRSVARIVQRTAKVAGLDASRFAGHSLRSGFATTAARKGKSLDAIMKQTGHRSERVARGYIRHASLFTGNAAAGLL